MAMDNSVQAGRIPIRAAQEVANKFGLKQCLLIGWDGDLTHVVTYGKTPADCEAAAKAQEFWTGHIREFSFKSATAIVMPLEPTAKMVGEMEALAEAMFSKVHKIDVVLLYKVAIQCELSRLAFAEAGLDEDGRPM